MAENLEFLRGLVSEHVDIVFANEDEAKTFTCEAEPLNALQAISQMCELAVVKIGTKGALIKQGEEVVHVGIMAAAKRVDTTGAGDFYAAGFLAGLCDGLSLRQCGTIGAITAGKVIEVGGTTPDGLFSLDSLRCVGACGLAPVVMIGPRVYGRLKVTDVKGILDEIQALEKEI